MILVRANNIKSGWKTIFVVATNAAPDSNGFLLIKNNFLKKY